MARITWTLGLVLSAALLATWAFGGTEWGILNASRAPIDRLHAEIAARTPDAAQTAGAEETSTAAQSTPTQTPCVVSPKFVQSWTLATGCYSSASPTSSITIPNDPDMLLMVETDSTSATGLVVDGVTGNGTALTLAASIDIGGGEGTMDTYYVVDPAPGTYTISFTMSGGSTCSWAATATLYQDVDTADPIGATVSGGNSSAETSETDTITTTSAGSLIQDYVANFNLYGSVSATNGTQLWPNNAASTGNGNIAYGSYLQTTAAGVYNLNYSASSPESWWEYEVVEIKGQNSCATATPTFTSTDTPTQTPTAYPTVCGGPPAFVQSMVLNGVGVSGTTGCAGSVSPTSFTYYIPALPGEILIVQVESTNPVLSGVTWANAWLSPLPSDSSVAVTGGGTIYTYYLVDPMPGPSTLVFNVTSGCSWNAVASVYDNVNWASPFGAINTSAGDATTFADGITTEGTSSIIHDFFAYQNWSNFTGMNGTQLFASNTSQCCDYVYGSYLSTSAPGAYTLDYTQPGPASDDWTGVSIELEGSADCGTPTMVPTPVPPQMPNPYAPVTASVLGTVPCSGSVQGASPAILRSVADWNNYMAGAGCDTPAGALNLSTFNFAAQSVLILQYQDCGSPITVSMDPGPGVYQVTGVNGVNEYLAVIANLGFSPLPSPAPTGCESVAIAIPATTQPVSWTVCEQSPSYHCVTFVTP